MMTTQLISIRDAYSVDGSVIFMANIPRRSFLFGGTIGTLAAGSPVAATSLATTATKIQSPAIIADRSDLFPALTPGTYSGLDLTGNHSSASQIKAATADAAGNRLLVPEGRFIFDDPAGLTISQPTKILGAGVRFATSFIFTGTGQRIVRTQRTHPDDGIDPPLSAAISVEAAEVSLEDFYIQCQFDTKNEKGWGADWDCGVFVKSVPYFKARNFRTDGYWRQAGLYYDVTKERGGCDQSSLEACRLKGFWGLRVEGPQTKGNKPVPDHSDKRGGGGMSSFYGRQLVLEGNTSKNQQLRFSDSDGGGLRMNGQIPTTFGRLNNFEFQQTRIVTGEPYLYFLDAISGVTFRKFHGERVTGIFKDGFSPDGAKSVVGRITGNAVDVVFEDATHANVVKDWEMTAIARELNCRDVTSSTVGESVTSIKQ